MEIFLKPDMFSPNWWCLDDQRLTDRCGTVVSAAIRSFSDRSELVGTRLQTVDVGPSARSRAQFPIGTGTDAGDHEPRTVRAERASIAPPP
ncbi:hypothetical protein [Micromonospora sp. RTGN7]|uniref:hypothetical protein n=1 Tax=Micromonospora sp. RTGN7 TaxID=3016526 RepID=UPI0029FF1D07|nr:hypothetical protein [Micromonospora sp. RTGN7]